jgi:hypothetical protein
LLACAQRTPTRHQYRQKKAISAANIIHVATLEHDSITSLHAVPHFDVSPPPILIHSSLPLHNVATINEMAFLLVYE